LDLNIDVLNMNIDVLDINIEVSFLDVSSLFLMIGDRTIAKSFFGQDKQDFQDTIIMNYP